MLIVLCSFHFRELLPISEDFVLTSYEGEDSPQTARLDGVPGAGKTTFLKHLVHKSSQKFLKFTGERVTVDVGDFSTMVYTCMSDQSKALSGRLYAVPSGAERRIKTS